MINADRIAVLLPVRKITWMNSIQLCHRLDITPMTLHLWRKGKGAGIREPIPFKLIEYGTARHRVLFASIEIEQWLSKYKPVYIDKLHTNKCPCKECAAILSVA